VYKRKFDLCFNLIQALRLNLVNLKVNLLKFTDDLNKLILCFKINLLLEKLLFIFIKHDHRRIIRLKHLILIK